MKTWRSLGSAQRRVLIAAANDAGRSVLVTMSQEYIAALRLHEHGLLNRGKTSFEFVINEKGLELTHGTQ